MNRIAISLATAVALMGGLASAGLAQDSTTVPVADSDVYTETSESPIVFISDYRSWGLTGSAEAVFLKYGRTDGTRVGVVAPGEDVNSNYEITPRVTFGWVGEDGFGARVRYWEYDHATPANEGGDSNLSVDTYICDFELFETFALNDNWIVEFAGGLRYNQFEEFMTDDGDNRINRFSGLGGLVSGELRRMIGAQSAVFGRARGAMIMDDKRIFNNDTPPIQNVVLGDVTVGMLELAIGYDYLIPLGCGNQAFIRGQAEWQNWYNYSSSFTDLNNAERFAGGSDVSFHGFGISMGIVALSRRHQRKKTACRLGRRFFRFLAWAEFFRIQLPTAWQSSSPSRAW